MNKIGIFIVFIAAACLAALGQTPQPTPTGAPPVLKGDTPSNSGQPPVIKGGAGPLNGGSVQSPSASPSPSKTSKFKDDDVISVETNLVTTPVSVLDRAGRFIPGLKEKDFKIFDNDVQQKITYFQSEEQPFTVILLIDISPSTKYKIDEIHFAAITFINQLRPVDKVMVVAFDQRVHVLTETPTSDRKVLYSAIYKANFGSGTSLYEAINYVTDLDLIKVPGRKAVVIFSDGVDTTSRRSSYQSTLAGVQEVDALIYSIHYSTENDTGTVAVSLPPDIGALLAARGLTVDPRAIRGYSRGQSPIEYKRGRDYLDALAQNTGGRMFEAASITNLDESFKGVAEELRRQYSIGYYPEDSGQPGDRRQVKIKVARPNAVVRAKNGYVVRQVKSGS